MCRFTMCESTRWGGGGGGCGGKPKKERQVFSKGIFLKNHSYLLVFSLVRILTLMHCFTEYV